MDAYNILNLISIICQDKMSVNICLPLFAKLSCFCKKIVIEYPYDY